MSQPVTAAPAPSRMSTASGPTPNRSFSLLLRDVLAGLVAAVVLTANAVSFAALIFPLEIADGARLAIWGMLVGSCIAGVWIAWSTSIPPIATGIDSPLGAVLVIASPAIAAHVAARGDTPDVAIVAVMTVFTGITVTCGLAMSAIGVMGWGRLFRFVPYCVVGGFLAATGWFLSAGGFRMTTGRSLTPEGLATPLTGAEWARLAAAVGVLGVLLVLRRWVKSAFTLPIALIIIWALGALVLRASGFSAAEHGWYVPAMPTLERWRPYEAPWTSTHVWPTFVSFIPEILAGATVALISLIAKVSSIEVTRQASADLDREFRAHGVASLLMAPLGGVAAGVQVGSSKLLLDAGGATWRCGVIASLALGAIALSNFNVLNIIPLPIIAGLVLFLGYGFFTDALRRPFQQRAWLDLFLSIAIMLVCVRYGYILGVLAGLVCACLLFAVSYARVGIVSRHLTRAEIASNVDRPVEDARFLREKGGAIHVYWLNGYMFFGSSESVFERVKMDAGTQPAGEGPAYVILDFARVTGTDTSVLMSLSKLRNFCDQQRVTIVYSALPPATHAMLQVGGFFGPKSRHKAFADRYSALEWCENQLLADAGRENRAASEMFDRWVLEEVGDARHAAALLRYFRRRELVTGEVLYRQGETAETIDLIVAGSLSIDVEQSGQGSQRVRRIATNAMIGEMGFFRRATRSATVTSQGSAVIYTLTRAAFETMRAERPELAQAFSEIVIRQLADRVDFANREVAVLAS